MAPALAYAHLLKRPLAEVVRQPTDVIHVAVTQRNVRRAQRDSRAHADVECDVQLRDLHDRLLAGDADALDSIGRNVKEPDLPRSRGSLGEHGETSVRGAFTQREKLIPVA